MFDVYNEAMDASPTKHAARVEEARRLYRDDSNSANGNSSANSSTATTVGATQNTATTTTDPLLRLVAAPVPEDPADPRTATASSDGREKSIDEEGKEREALALDVVKTVRPFMDFEERLGPGYAKFLDILKAKLAVDRTPAASLRLMQNLKGIDAFEFGKSWRTLWMGKSQARSSKAVADACATSDQPAECDRIVGIIFDAYNESL